MPLFGSFAFGAVMGWLAVLVHRPARATSARSAWRTAAAVLAGWACAGALPWFYAGSRGVLAAALGTMLGTLTALAMPQAMANR